MTKINTTAAFSALDAFALAGDTARTTLCVSLIAAGIVTREDALPVVTAWAAERCDCPLVDGQKRMKGQMVFDATSPNYSNAQKTRGRVLDAFAPTEARVERQEAAAEAEAKATKAKATKAEKAAHAALQEARKAVAEAEAAFLAACGGNKPRAKALDKALSA